MDQREKVVALVPVLLVLHVRYQGIQEA
jgi:hypothetical protein